MITQTEGIVLHTIKYSESSIIAHIFTKEYGAGTYIMNNVRGKQSKMAYFQTFSHVSLSVYRKKNASMYRITTIEFASMHFAIYSDILKACMCQFLGEFLHKVLHSEETNSGLYTHLLNSINKLEHTQTVSGIFHIIFLLQTTEYFGITPHNNWSPTNHFFNMHAGNFCAYHNSEWLNEKTSLSLHKTMNNSLSPPIPLQEKIVLLEALINYYRIHIHYFGAIKSLAVLQTVFE